jgi:hypothetical protein
LNTAYSTSLIGGSGYFDRSGDWLSTPSNAAFTFGTGDYTVECWFYPLVADGTNQSIWSTNWGANGALLMTYDHPSVGSKKFGLFDYTINSGAPTLTSSSAFPINQWNHVVIARSGTTVKMFVNGFQQASATQSTNLTRDVFAVSSVYSGSATETSYGYISGLRVVKGTAVYTTAFTPPTAPPTAITNTSLLLNYTNAGIYDNTAKNVLETVGNAQISTTQSKWGGVSMAFDGAGDWLQMPFTQTTSLSGTIPFTIEFWVYMNSLAARGTVVARNNGSTAAGSQFDLNIETTGQVNVAFYTGGATISTNSATGVITTGRWIHVALSKDSVGGYRIFVDGIQSGSTTTNTGAINSPTIPMTVGAQNTSGGVSLNGYIDDLRITNGVARYTTNFTPPTSQLQDQ